MIDYFIFHNVTWSNCELEGSTFHTTLPKSSPQFGVGDLFEFFDHLFIVTNITEDTDNFIYTIAHNPEYVIDYDGGIAILTDTEELDGVRPSKVAHFDLSTFNVIDHLENSQNLREFLNERNIPKEHIDCIIQFFYYFTLGELIDKFIHFEDITYKIVKTN